MIKPRMMLTAVVLAASAAAVPAVTSPGTAHAAGSPITHIVVLMEENHSFDQALGDWCNQTGRCAGIPSQVTLSNGATITPSVSPDTVPNITHTSKAQAKAINSGAMNGWQSLPAENLAPGTGCAAPGYACISYYTAASQPNLTSLATTYGVENAAFTEADSPSFAGHLNEFAATTDGFIDNPRPVKGVTQGPGWGCNSNKAASWMSPAGVTKIIPSCVPDYKTGLPNGGAYRPTPAAHVPTIMDRLDAAGVSWNIYSALKGQSGYIWAGCPSFAGCLDTSQGRHQVSDRRFFTRAAAGTLPGVSFVMPHTQYSQHNMQSNTAGDNFIGQVANAVMSSPDWASTALIITWDDCGCFYDQVPPPLAPDGGQMGPRVPFVVVSPYARPGIVDSTQTASTGSILAFIESTFGLPALGVNDAGAYNLSGMFSFAAAPRLAHPAMTWRHLPASAYRVNPAAANDGT